MNTQSNNQTIIIRRSLEVNCLLYSENIYVKLPKCKIYDYINKRFYLFFILF